MSEDPFKYIAAQISEGTAKPPPLKKPERASAPVHPVETSTNNVAQHVHSLDHDFSSPSNSSNRDTINTTTTADYATPLTSAGLTPGESARRFSDAARKSYNSTKKPGSSLRNESQFQSKSRTTSTSNLAVHRSLDGTNPEQDVEAIKRTLRLVTDDYSRPQSSSSRSMENSVNPLRFSLPDLNKSLPPPPPLETDSASDDQKQQHISRLMKTIKKKKSTPAVAGRSQSTAEVTSSNSVNKQPAKPSLYNQDHPKTPYPLTESSPTKKRFRLRLFTKRHRPADVLVT